MRNGIKRTKEEFMRRLPRSWVYNAERVDNGFRPQVRPRTPHRPLASGEFKKHVSTLLLLDELIRLIHGFRLNFLELS